MISELAFLLVDKNWRGISPEYMLPRHVADLDGVTNAAKG